MTNFEKILAGLTLISHRKNPDLCAEHDTIYARCDEELDNSEIGYLKDWGWNRDFDDLWIYFI